MSDLTWAGNVFTGGYFKSSKLSIKEYLMFVLKNRLSLRINCVSFSNSKAPLKKSSLDAKNGWNLILLDVLNDLVFSLSYIKLEFFS